MLKNRQLADEKKNANEGSPDKRRFFDYLPPRDDDLRARRDLIATTVAIILSAITVFGVVVVVVYILSNLFLGDPAIAPPTNYLPTIMNSIAATIILGGIALYQWKHRGSSAFAPGLLIGIGIAALVEGICFAVLTL